MDIVFVKSKLNEGDVFKNRQALCEQLEVPYTNQTNPKISQDKDFRKFFEFEKIKGTQQIRITKIYDCEKPNFSTKGGSMPKLLDPAVFMCIAKKCMQLPKRPYITISSLAEEAGICSKYVTKFYNSDGIYYELRKKFSSSSNDENKESKVFKIMAGYVYKARSSYKKMIGGSLDRLAKENYIKVEEVMLINGKKLNSEICKLIRQEKYDDLKKLVVPTIYDKIYENIILNDEKNEDYFMETELWKLGITDDEVREVSAEERSFIEEVRNEVLKDFDCANLQELYKTNARHPSKIRAYYNECNKRYSEYNVNNFSAYRIDWCNCESAMQQGEELEDLAKKVNAKFIENFRKSAKTDSEDNINDDYIEKLRKHNEKGLGKMRDTRKEKMKAVENNLATFINEFLRV